MDAARWAPSDGRPGAGPGPQRPGVPGVPGRWGGLEGPGAGFFQSDQLSALSQRSAAFCPSSSPSSWLGVGQRACWVTRRCPRGQLSGQHHRPWGRSAPSGLRGPASVSAALPATAEAANTGCKGPAWQAPGSLPRPLTRTAAADDTSAMCGWAPIELY